MKHCPNCFFACEDNAKSCPECGFVFDDAASPSLDNTIPKEKVVTNDKPASTYVEAYEPKKEPKSQFIRDLQNDAHDGEEYVTIDFKEISLIAKDVSSSVSVKLGDLWDKVSPGITAFANKAKDEASQIKTYAGNKVAASLSADERPSLIADDDSSSVMLGNMDYVSSLNKIKLNPNYCLTAKGKALLDGSVIPGTYIMVNDLVNAKL